MWDYNVWHEDGRSPEDLDAWTDDLEEARQIAADYLARTGAAPIITRYPMRETPDGFRHLSGGEYMKAKTLEYCHSCGADVPAGTSVSVDELGPFINCPSCGGSQDIDPENVTRQGEN